MPPSVSRFFISLVGLELAPDRSAQIQRACNALRASNLSPAAYARQTIIKITASHSPNH